MVSVLCTSWGWYKCSWSGQQTGDGPNSTLWEGLAVSASAPHFHVKSGNKAVRTVHLNCVSTGMVSHAQSGDLRYSFPQQAAQIWWWSSFSVSQMTLFSGVACQDCLFRAKSSMTHQPQGSFFLYKVFHYARLKKKKKVTSSVKYSVFFKILEGKSIRNIREEPVSSSFLGESLCFS